VSVTTEVHRKIYDDQDGTFLNVSPDSDGLGTVTVWASNEESRVKYFPGGLLEINHAMATALALAIRDCGEESSNLMMEHKP
jgi:hypothetical protein